MKWKNLISIFRLLYRILMFLNVWLFGITILYYTNLIIKEPNDRNIELILELMGVAYALFMFKLSAKQLGIEFIIDEKGIKIKKYKRD